MTPPDRRTFLRRAVGAVPAAAVVGSLGLEGCAGVDQRPRGGLTRERVVTLAESVLPTGALGEAGTRETAGRFMTWVDGFRPEAELNHPYLDEEIRYALRDPRSRWSAQMDELDRLSGGSLADLTASERRARVAEVLQDAPAALPSDPAAADHVAVALLAWFYGSSQANDLCYDRAIGRHDCRGIEGLPGEPIPLEEAGA